MQTGHRPSRHRQDVDPACVPRDPLEQRVGRSAQLVLQLTSMGDRYQAPLMPDGPRESRARVARLRRAAQAARDDLVGMALGGRTESIPSPGESEAQQESPWHSALSARTVLGQAQGLIMQRHHVGASAALEILTLVARDRAVTLGEVSHEVVGAQEHDGA